MFYSISITYYLSRAITLRSIIMMINYTKKDVRFRIEIFKYEPPIIFLGSTCLFQCYVYPNEIRGDAIDLDIVEVKRKLVTIRLNDN